MIFGTVLKNTLMVEKAPAEQRIYGAWVALESFYKGLLTYGTFDEYHFFVDSRKTAEAFRNNLSLLGINSNKIKIIQWNELISHLERTPYTVFLGDGMGDLIAMARLRARYPDRLFPIAAFSYSISYPTMLRDKFFESMISSVYPFDSVICISTPQREAIRNLMRLVSGHFSRRLKSNIRYNGRLDFLPLGVPTGDYEKTSKREARRRLGLPQDKTIILYFGRLSLYDKMDLEPLLIAFKALINQGTDPLLLFAGKDAQKQYGDKVKKMARDMGVSSKTRFFLNPPLEHKHLLYAASDIFVSPSDNIQESFGITLLEAMAAGLPVVASDWDGYRNIVLHGKTGYLIPTYWAACDSGIANLSEIKTSFFADDLHDHLGLAQSVCVDVPKMTEYLSRLVKDKGLRLRLGQNAKRRISEEYDWKVLIPRYEKLWKRLYGLSKKYNTSGKQKEILLPEYFDCFRHYPTRVLDRRTKITITEKGKEFLRTKKIPQWPENLVGLLSMNMIFTILHYLFKENIATLGQIERNTKQILRKPFSNERIMYNLLWLLKKDLMKVV